MSRGDQRDRDRAKRQQKEAEKGVKKEGNPQQRNESDAAALKAKLAAKAAAAAAASTDNNAALNTNTSKEPIKPKKIVKKSDNLEDLLASGLDAGKKKRLIK